MSPQERRDALIEATLPLLVEHGRSVTTRQIADAAGVAEGTIFRVFETKEELVHAALHQAFLWDDHVAAVKDIDRSLPLEDRLVELVTLMQGRFTEIFGLMRSVGMVAPPEDHDHTHERARWIQQMLAAMIEVVRPDAKSLTVPAAEVIHLLRLLTFSGTHPEISLGHTLTPQQIVHVVLHGVEKRGR